MEAFFLRTFQMKTFFHLPTFPFIPYQSVMVLNDLGAALEVIKE